MEKHKSLNKLLYAVQSVRLHIVDCVQKREDDFKSTQTGFVCRVLNDGNTQILFLAPPDCPSVFHLIIVVGGVTAKDQHSIIFQNILNTHHGGIAQGRGIDHKGIARVKRENLKRSFVLFHISRTIGKNHAVGSSTNVRPISQLLILCGLILRQSIIIELRDFLGNFLVIPTTDILDRLTHQIANLERYDFIGSVLNDFVIDFRPNFFLSVKNRLISLVVSVQITNICLVHEVNEQGLLQNINDVIIVDCGHIGINHPAAK